MFALNLQSWKNSDFIRAEYCATSILELEEALIDIAGGESSAYGIEWTMRQRAWLKE